MLSVIYIVKNGGELFRQSLASVAGWADDIVVVDNGSTDHTAEIARTHHARIFTEYRHHEGILRQIAFDEAKYPWILVLDHDEVITDELKKELYGIVKHGKPAAYLVRFQNHLFGRPLRHGGETYTKLAFFHRTQIELLTNSVHARFVARNHEHTHTTLGVVLHYSYQSVSQILSKFTDYGIRLGKERYQRNESLSFKKIVLYAPHMFWARFIKDQGYKDGLARIVLDGAFAYMELLSYLALVYYRLVHAHRGHRGSLPHKT